jgi:hypothetical protein
VMMVALDVGTGEGSTLGSALGSPLDGATLILGSKDIEGSRLMLGTPDGALLILGSVEGSELGIVLGSLLTVGDDVVDGSSLG